MDNRSTCKNIRNNGNLIHLVTDDDEISCHATFGDVVLLACIYCSTLPFCSEHGRRLLRAIYNTKLGEALGEGLHHYNSTLSLKPLQCTSSRLVLC